MAGHRYSADKLAGIMAELAESCSLVRQVDFTASGGAFDAPFQAPMKPARQFEEGVPGSLSKLGNERLR